MVTSSFPLFSVIIPTYNHANFIGRVIESLLNQTYSNWEAIIINNFSTDNTIEIVNRYNDQRIKLVNFRNNGIIAASRNHGIAQAKGEWICFLDSDDWWYPDKLEVTSKYLYTADILYHDLDVFRENKKIFLKKIKCRKLKGDIIKDLIINSNALPNSSVVVKRTIIEKVGKISEQIEMVAIEDSDYWIRIADITERFCYIPKSLGAYYIHNNLSISEKQIDRENFLYTKHKNRLTINEQKLAEKMLFYKQARIYHKLGLYKKANKNYFSSLTEKKKILSFKAIALLFLSFLKYRI